MDLGEDLVHLALVIFVVESHRIDELLDVVGEVAEIVPGERGLHTPIFTKRINS